MSKASRLFSIVALLSLAMSLAMVNQGRAANSQFLAAVALLAKDHKSAAYEILEKVFNAKDSTEWDRSRAAMILAYASNRELKAAKRHIYAEYYLDHGIGGETTPAQRDSLLRIAGDGFFDAGELDRATAFYEDLIRKSKEPENVDYAHYKLGWIDLNREQPHRAFYRWIKRVNGDESDGGDLRESLIRDVGRTWAESSPPSPDQTKAVKNLSLKEDESQKFVDGVILGLRRLKKPAQVASFRASLFQTQYATPVFHRVMAQSLTIAQDPCAVLDWLDGPVKIDQSKTKDMGAALNFCLVRLKKEHANSKTEDWMRTDTVERLIRAAERLEVTGADRWMRAEFYRDLHDDTNACGEFVMMGLNLAQAKAPMPADANAHMVDSCKEFAKNASQKPARAKAISESFVGMLRKQAETGQLDKDTTKPAYTITAEFSAVPGFVEKLRKDVFENPASYARSQIPSIVVGSLKKDEQLKSGGVFLENFAPRPIASDEGLDAVWIELLRSQISLRVNARDFKGAKELLSRHLPLSAPLFKRKVAPELWFMWVLALPPEFTGDGRQVTRAYLDLWNEELGQLPERQNLLLAAAVKFGEIEPVWQKFRTMDWASKADTTLLTQFYQKTFEQLVDFKMSPKSVEKEKRVGKCYQMAVDVAGDPKVSSGDLGAVLKCQSALGSAAPAFLDDLKRVIALAQEGRDAKSRLFFNSLLSKRIETRFKRLNNQIEALKSQQWSHPAMAKLARMAIGHNCGLFIDELGSIPQPKGLTDDQKGMLKNTITPVVELVRSWQQAVLKDIVLEKKS